MDRHADGYAYLKGESTEAGTAHVESCPTCQQEIQETQSVLGLLHTLPEIEPSPEVWTRIESKIEQPVRVYRPRVAFFGKMAAAAAILVVAAVWLTRPTDRMVATVSSASPGSGIAPGTRINLGETFHSPSFATLTLPGAGTLKLNRDTTLRFDSRRRVTLLQGEVFAEITPGGAGFEVASGDSTVSVLGTKFGVKHGEAAYVAEGKVKVTGPAGQLTLASDEAGSLAPKRLLDGVQAYLRWLHSMERPTLVVRARPRGPSILLPGKPLEIDLAFASDAPLLADDPRNSQHYLILQIKASSGRPPSLASLDLANPRSSRIVLASNGKVLLDVDKEAVVTFLLEPGLFPERDLYSISVLYINTGARMEAVSEPFLVEVRS